MQTMPEASPELLGLLVEQRADFASSCCPPNSLPLYCASKVKPWSPPTPSAVPAAAPRPRGCPSPLSPLVQVSWELGAACDGGSCLLG